MGTLVGGKDGNGDDVCLKETKVPNQADNQVFTNWCALCGKQARRNIANTCIFYAS